MLSQLWKTIHYLGPSVENHGHWVMKEGEIPHLTRCILKPVNETSEVHWIALERELLDGLTLRRRLREKTTIKRMEKPGSDPEEERKRKNKAKIKKVIEDEMLKTIYDPPNLAAYSITILGRLRKMIEDHDEEEEEVLQTRIVLPTEVASQWISWCFRSSQKRGRKNHR